MAAQFRFKQFAVEHEKSTMKVGTDAVLLGAWTEVGPDDRVLDVGCGCGVISLMLAQRMVEKGGDARRIRAIDIDEASANEARENFYAAPWSTCPVVFHNNIFEYARRIGPTFALIVSNPPYFSRSLKSPSESRTIARHNDTLPREGFLRCCRDLLIPDGRLALVLPPEAYREITDLLPRVASGLKLERLTQVYSKEGKPVERLLVQYRMTDTVPVVSTDTLVIHTAKNGYTSQYLNLVKDYLLLQ